MKLIVMGAGYVGMALLNYFQGQNHEIYITTTREERIETLKPYGKEVVLLNNELRLQELIDSCDGMIVMVAPHQNQSYEHTYLDTAKKISFALKDRKTPFYILYTGSTSVCEGLEEWVTEETPLFPKSENGKILLETEFQYLNCNAKACVLRLGGIYGPQRELIERAKRFSGKEMPGTGDEPTNHSHLEDIVAGIAFCLSHSLSGIYHLVSDDHTMRKELYTGLTSSLDLPPPLWNRSQGRMGGYKISNQKIKQAGFVFKHPLISGTTI